MAGGGRQAEADGRRAAGDGRRAAEDGRVTNNERKRKVAGSKPPPTNGSETRNENRPKRPGPGQKPAKKAGRRAVSRTKSGSAPDNRGRSLQLRRTAAIPPAERTPCGLSPGVDPSEGKGAEGVLPLRLTGQRLPLRAARRLGAVDRTAFGGQRAEAGQRRGAEGRRLCRGG